MKRLISICFSFIFTMISFSASARQVDAGQHHSMMLCADGTVWTWGWNNNGQLGDNTTTRRLIRVQVVGLTDVIAISAGAYHSLALKSDGTVWSWGLNNNGQLGDNTTSNRLVPVQVFNLANVVAISAGFYHNIALRSDGTVWTWGYNARGQLGDGTTTDRYLPAPVSGLTNVTEVSGYQLHTLVLRNDSTVWGWGISSSGELGDGGGATNRLSPVQMNVVTDVITLGGGGHEMRHSMVLRSDSTVWVCGRNNYGQLGDGTTATKLTPIQVPGLTSVVDIAGGYRHSLVARSDGTVWAWGLNNVGQLGDGTTTNRLSPVQRGSLTGIVAVSGGYQFNLITRIGGTIWATGHNFNGKLGDNTTTNRRTPIRSSTLCLVITLPIELLYFTAAWSNNDYNAVLLEWKTFSEINNDYFTVERSSDGINFIPIGNVAGAGNSNIALKYALTDDSPSLGVNYYRLKQTDFDYKFSYSNVIAIGGAKKGELSIYPNPSTRFITINQGDESLMNAIITVFDAQGKMVLNQAIQDDLLTHKIDVSSFNSGIYFVKVNALKNSFKGTFLKK